PDPTISYWFDERMDLPPTQLWMQYDRANRSDSDLVPLIRMMAFTHNNRITPLVQSPPLAFFHLGGSTPRNFSASNQNALRFLFRESWPPSETEFAARFETQLRNGQAEAAASEFQQFAPGILLECAVSQEKGMFWIDHAKQWVQSGLPENSPLLRFYIDVL